MKITLQDIHARITAAIMPRDFTMIVLLELLPLLKEASPLKNAYDARVHYYERLSKSKQYLVLIQAIHALMQDIHQLIDPSKFPKKDSRPMYFHPSAYKLMNAQEMHALLLQKEQWACLGRKTISGFRDSILYPWRAVLTQYLRLISWIQYAIEVGAADESAVRPYLKHLRASYGTLKQLLADPFKRLHIMEFEHFHVSTLDSEKLLADESPKAFLELRDAANQVCQDLLSVLETVEAEERQAEPSTYARAENVPTKSAKPNSDSHSDSDPQKYLNIVTDFGLKVVWIEGQKETSSKSFHEKSAIYYLWKYLLDHKGEVQTKAAIRNYVAEQTGRMNELRGIAFGKTLENLQRKLAGVANISLKEAAKWFEESDETLSLKNLD